MKEEAFDKALMNVINELKAPKGQRNSFGNYNYRSAEDIIDAVKPLLFKEGLRMKISDTVELIGERYYVKAVVTVSGFGGNDSASGYAREAEDKKGMDDAQITGSASSYARKYALNGMFDIDDTKDADSNEYRKQTTQVVKPKEIRDRQAESNEAKKETLVKAKETINKELEKQDYTRPDSKKAFIKRVLEKETIDSLDDAELVMQQLENEA